MTDLISIKLLISNSKYTKQNVENELELIAEKYNVSKDIALEDFIKYYDNTSILESIQSIIHMTYREVCREKFRENLPFENKHYYDILEESCYKYAFDTKTNDVNLNKYNCRMILLLEECKKSSFAIHIDENLYKKNIYDLNLESNEIKTDTINYKFDKYKKCRKCGEKKMIMKVAQKKASDEISDIVWTCMNCHS